MIDNTALPSPLPTPNGAPPGMPGMTAFDEQVIIELAPDALEMEEAAAMGLLGMDAPPEPPFDANLAEFMDESDLTALASDLCDAFKRDLQSRKEWEETYMNGLDLLGFKYEARTQPWEGACGVFHPLLGEAVVRFQSEAITETFPASGPVRTTIVGRETPELQKVAKRVAEDMNFRLTEEMEEYRVEHERMLWHLALAGSAFKKVYYDPTLGRQTSLFVAAEDFVVPLSLIHI